MCQTLVLAILRRECTAAQPLRIVVNGDHSFPSTNKVAKLTLSASVRKHSVPIAERVSLVNSCRCFGNESPLSPDYRAPRTERSVSAMRESSMINA